MLKPLNFAIKLLLSFFLIYTVSSVNASHTAGGYVTYKRVGNNEYQLTLTHYENCATAFMVSSPITIEANNICGYANPSISLPNSIFQQQISQLCPASLANSACNGGTLPGLYMHQWQGVVTLPGNCDHWTFAYEDCCHETMVNVYGQPYHYWESRLYSTTDPLNSGVYILAPTVTIVGVNQFVSHNIGAVDPDGDSLSYEIVPTQSSAFSTVTYNTGYSGTAPIPGITISTDGKIEFTTSMVGVYLVTVRIKEWDSNGNLVGSNLSDYRFNVVNTTNQNVNAFANGLLTNVSGGAVQTGFNSLEMCSSDSANFQLIFKDPDIGDSLSLITDMLSVFPGAMWTVNYPNGGLGQYDSVIVDVSWAPPSGYLAGINLFSVSVIDDQCPIHGQQTFGYSINVLDNYTLTADTLLCPSDTSTLTFIMDTVTNVNWTVVSGDPIVPGVNFGCNNCNLTWARPSVTTVYAASATSSCGSVITDSVTVVATPNYIYDVYLVDSVICFGDCTDIVINVLPSGYPHVFYTPYGGLTMSDSIFDPFIIGTGGFAYSLTSPEGCVHHDTIPYEQLPSLSSTQNIAFNGTSYVWPLNGMTYTSSGSYSTVLSSVNGCDSTVNLNLTLWFLDTTVSFLGLGTGLMSNQNGGSYQWLDASNGLAPIPGANQQTYLPTQNGLYAVQIVYNIFTDTSTVTPFFGLSADNINPEILQVYPNPASDHLTVLCIGEDIELSIHDLSGRRIEATFDQTTEGTYTADITELPSGCYLLKLTSDGNEISRQILVQH